MYFSIKHHLMFSMHQYYPIKKKFLCFGYFEQVMLIIPAFITRNFQSIEQKIFFMVF